MAKGAKGGLMPTLEISYHDLCSLAGTRIPKEELKTKAIMFAKGEIDGFEGDEIKIDSKDTNRPDLWSAEGTAREIAGRYGKKGLPQYKTEKSGLTVKVEKSVKNVRPYTVCAVVRNLTITDEFLKQMIQLQEKVDGTFGRNRRDVSTGIYDYRKIKGNVTFKAVSPTGIKFIPLRFEKEMTPAQILKEHPKGQEYGHLLKGYDKYPLFIDDKGNVLSLPPIINSDYTGKVTEHTEDVFIEVSGFNLDILMTAINVFVCALADRGGKIETVDVVYPDKTITTPQLKPKKFKVKRDYINKITGLGLSDKDIKELLETARYNVEIKGDEIHVEYPAYRQDIMHQRDIVEDILISKGYNQIEPLSVGIKTKGGLDSFARFGDKIGEIVVGLGFQEILSYTLTNKDNLFKKMCMKEEDVCELENPVSMNWSIFRKTVLPGILEFFSKNKHYEIPQKVFEIGTCVIPDERAETRYRDNQRLACGITARQVTYEEVASIIDALMRAIGINYKFRKTENPSFIKGRCAEIMAGAKIIGILGEVNPRVLNNWEIENPVVGFEVDLDSIFKK